MNEKWQRDLEVYRNINHSFIIAGNIHDHQLWFDEEDDPETISLSGWLFRYLEQSGYESVVFYSLADGFHNPGSSKMSKEFVDRIQVKTDDMDFLTAAQGIRKGLSSPTIPTAVIVSLANTLIASPEACSPDELKAFSTLLMSTKEAKQAVGQKKKTPLNNLLILVTEKVNDIPAWFYLSNPFVRTLNIGKPSKETRKQLISSRIDMLYSPETEDEEAEQKHKDEFVSLTEGMTLIEIYGIFTLCMMNHYGLHQIRDAIKLFRYGNVESYWEKLDRQTILNAEPILQKRVKGQPAVLKKTVDILSRSYLDMSAIQGTSSSHPKGVLFFVGPTGTGKTELAKAISELVFGDEEFVTRFDMSEYSQAHSDQKLIGAPPGYVGYEAGGQLTNAMKERPFSVLLFDEIEKAHPSILDKFLQILEDGRMTDSSGETVYFSESLIIFTSNLGVVTRDQKTGEMIRTITPDMDYDLLKERLLKTVKDYFTFTIQRPEILNRIGENVVVFDFIRPESARAIVRAKLNTIQENLRQEKNLQLEIEPGYEEFLISKALGNLENGGRGIGNIIEEYFINPFSRNLARALNDSARCISIGYNPEADDPMVFRIF